MRAIEFDVNGMDTVLSGDEPYSVLIWRREQGSAVTRGPDCLVVLVKSDRLSHSDSVAPPNPFKVS